MTTSNPAPSEAALASAGAIDPLPIPPSRPPRPVRVLTINAGNMHGGVEVLLTALARHRAAYPAVEPHFALCFTGRTSDELAALGVAVHQLGEVQIRRPRSVWRARGRLRDLLRLGTFDLVVCHAAWSQAIFGPVVRRERLPLVFWLHDPPDRRPLHWLEHWARRTPPDLTLCNSRYTAERVPRLYPDSPLALAYCPVTPLTSDRSNVARHTTRVAFATPDKATVFLQVGRWERHKGHLVHLEALSRLADRDDWRCWMVGAPNRPSEVAYQAEVAATAARLRIADRVQWLGWQEDLRPLLAAADVYCQPNIAPEPFGIALIEALSAGLPVVSTPPGGPGEIVTADCGLLVPPGDPEALAHALAQLMADPDRRARLAAGGPLRAAALCDPKTAVARIGQTLVSLVHRASPAHAR